MLRCSSPVYVLFKGQIINGARRSMSLFGIALQSAELLKIAVVLVIARVIAFNQERGGVTTFGVARCAFFVLLCSGLLFTQGLTNTLLLMGISISMMLIGGIQNRKLGIVLLIYLLIGGAGYMWKSHDKQSAAEVALIAETGKDASGEAATFNRTGTHKGRIARWLFDSIPKYEQPITSINRQEMYSFMAQANGGWHGVLPGNSRETARLPLAFSDYIFAIVIEDWGFMGGMLLLTAYLILLGRARRHRRRMPQRLPVAADHGHGGDDSAAGTVPHGHRHRRVSRVGSAAAADLQRRLVDSCHLHRFRHHALGEPFSRFQG